MKNLFNGVYSPGPWIDLTLDIPNPPAQWIQIYSRPTNGPSKLIGRIRVSAEETDSLANLGLILAAPDLYEALKGMLAFNGTLNFPPPDSWSQDGLSVNLKARAALKKAYGICPA